MSPTRRALLRHAAALGLAWPGPARARPTVTVRPAPGFADEALHRAIAALPRSGGATLVFEAGQYRFKPGQGAALLFDGIEDLSVDGNGAELLFSGGGIGMAFRGCAGLGVRDLSLDWADPPFTQATVTGVRDGGHALDLALLPGFTLEAGQTPGALHEVDASTGLVRLGSAETYGGLKIVKAGDGRATLSSTAVLTVVPGAKVVLRHQLYGGNAMQVSGCTGEVGFEGMTVRSAPGMALYARNCNGRLRVARFVVAPGAGRWLSTNADAIHAENCAGRIAVKECTLGAMGDDAVNVHSDYLRVEGVPDRRTIAVAGVAGRPPEPESLPHPGVAVAFLSGRSLRQTGTAGVASVKPGWPALLTLDTEIPAGLAVGDLVSEPGRGVELEVRGCTFPGNRGRGVVAHGRAYIERCRFHGQSRAAVVLAPDTRWLECCEITRSVVRDNVVEDSWRGAPAGDTGTAAITVAALLEGRTDDGAGLPDAVNHAVEIRGNHVSAPRSQAIRVASTRDVTIDDNVIHGSKGVAIKLASTDRASLSGNSCDPPGVVEVRNEPSSSLRFINNRGLALRRGS